MSVNTAALRMLEIRSVKSSPTPKAIIFDTNTKLLNTIERLRNI